MFWKNDQAKREHVVDDDGKLVVKRYDNPTAKYVEPHTKAWKKPMIIIGLILLAVLVWIGIGTFSALGKIITKNLQGGSPFLSFKGEINPDQLKGEGDSRINILLLGIGGAGHPGGQLADTIEILSINPKDKTAALLSIPRDLRVPIPDDGQDKINSAHSTGENNKKKYSGGPELMKKTISSILDLPIHYYIRIDFTGFIKFIDALGGIDIDVPKAISDPYYPDEKMKGYSPFSISAGKHHMDGKLALKYARSRETTSDFDRSKRQQQIIITVKEKALSVGVLTNPKKISEIMKILGDHLRTDFQLKEIERLFDLTKDIDTSKIVTKVLDSSSEGPLKSINNGGYYLVPKTGNFKEVQQVVHELFSDIYLAEENAQIEVYNATGKSGIASEISKTLKSYGYNVIKIDTYEKTLSQSKIIDYSGGKKSFTLQFLKNRFSTQVEIQPRPSGSTTDIVLIVGKNYDE